jgi:hypothetical protein
MTFGRGREYRLWHGATLSGSGYVYSFPGVLPPAIDCVPFRDKAGGITSLMSFNVVRRSLLRDHE